MGLAAFGLLSIALVCRQSGYRHAAARLLLAASAATAVWFAVLCLAAFMPVGGAVLDLLEALRTALSMLTAAWLLPRQDRGARRVRAASVVVASVFCLVPVFWLATPWVMPPLGSGRALGFMLANIGITCTAR